MRRPTTLLRGTKKTFAHSERSLHGINTPPSKGKSLGPPKKRLTSSAHQSRVFPAGFIHSRRRNPLLPFAPLPQQLPHGRIDPVKRQREHAVLHNFLNDLCGRRMVPMLFGGGVEPDRMPIDAQ
jgi:hypothetical protein